MNVSSVHNNPSLCDITSVWSYGLIIRTSMFNLNAAAGPTTVRDRRPLRALPRCELLTFVTLHQLRAESSSALNQQRGQPRPHRRC